MSTKPGTAVHGTEARKRLFSFEVELQRGCDRPQLAECARLELADALARDPELAADLLERLRLFAAEAEAERQHALHARVQPGQSPGELAGTEVLRGRAGGRLGVLVLDQVGVEALAVPDGRLEADRILHELEQLVHALDGEAALDGELFRRRVTVELLREDPAGAQDTARLLRHVDGQPDRAPLVGERAGHRLADPPGRIRRELVAELPVELLDRADQSQVAL